MRVGLGDLLLGRGQLELLEERFVKRPVRIGLARQLPKLDLGLILLRRASLDSLSRSRREVSRDRAATISFIVAWMVFLTSSLILL